MKHTIKNKQTNKKRETEAQ